MDGEPFRADGDQKPADGEQFRADGEQKLTDGEQFRADGEQFRSQFVSIAPRFLCFYDILSVVEPNRL